MWQVQSVDGKTQWITASVGPSKISSHCPSNVCDRNLIMSLSSLQSVSGSLLFSRQNSSPYVSTQALLDPPPAVCHWNPHTPTPATANCREGMYGQKSLRRVHVCLQIYLLYNIMWRKSRRLRTEGLYGSNHIRQYSTNHNRLHYKHSLFLNFCSDFSNL